MRSTSQHEIRNFLICCQQIIKSGRAKGWAQLALSIGANPTQLEELRRGDKESIPPHWISYIVQTFSANPQFIYFGQGSPLLSNVKKAS